MRHHPHYAPAGLGGQGAARATCPRKSRGCTIRGSSTTPAASASSSTSRAASRTRSCSRPSRCCATSITAAPAAARPTPATARACCIQMPHAFLKEVARKARLTLPGARASTAAASFSCRATRPRRRRLEEHFEQIVQSEGQSILGWRTRAGRQLHRSARRPRPASRSCARCSSAAIPALTDEAAFERKLYVIRKRAYSEIRASTMDGAEYWYVASLSHKTIVYKGMLLTGQLAEYFKDLQRSGHGDGAGAGALALQHQHLPELGPRASLPLHRPQRRDQHPARQHQLDEGPRGAVRVRCCSART